MTCTLNVHAPHGARMRLRASAGATSGAPLRIEALDKDDFSYAEVTWFVNDHALAKRIAEAINAAIDAFEIEEGWNKDAADSPEVVT
jgi:hypothetical protein